MERIEHEIEVSENMTVTLNIPKQLSVIEFLGIAKQAELLLKVAQKDVMPDSVSMSPRTYTPRKVWTPEKLEKFKEIFPTTSYDDLIAMPEFSMFTKQQLNGKSYNMGLKRAKIFVRVRKTSTYANDDTEKIVKLIKSDFSNREISEKFDGKFTTKQIGDKKKYLKNKGRI